MIYKFIRITHNISEKEQNRLIDNYLAKQGVVADKIVKDDAPLKGEQYDQRILFALCNTLEKSDAIIVSSSGVLSTGGIGELYEIVENCFITKGLRLIICNVDLDFDCGSNDPITKTRLDTFALCVKIQKEMSSSRTKAALDQRKNLLETQGYFISKSGRMVTGFGSPRKPSKQCHDKAGEVASMRANGNASNINFENYLRVFEERYGDMSICSNGMVWEKLAEELNQLGYTTATGLSYNRIRAISMYRNMKKRKNNQKLREGEGEGVALEENCGQDNLLKMESARKDIGIKSDKLELEKTKFENTLQTLEALFSDEDSEHVDLTPNVLTKSKTSWVMELLDMFNQNGFYLGKNQINSFAQSKGLMVNSMINQINEACFEVLDDNLIEESEDGWVVNKDYYEQINTEM